MSPQARIAVLLALALLVGIAILKQAGTHGPTRPPLSLAVPTQPASAPIYVAYEKGFFQREGLTATLQPYNTGKEALEAVIQGRSQFGATAATPLMFAGLRGEPIVVIATISESVENLHIIARKDRGVAAPRDLAGKRVGVSRGTSNEYFLYAYLIFNNLAQDSVERVDINPEQTTAALARGDIDAAVSWNPYLRLQRQQLGDNAVILSNPYIYLLEWNIVARRDFAQRNPQLVSSLLRALIKANDSITSQPEEARAIVARAVGDNAVALASYNFDVHLRQDLLINLESQARWAIASGLAEQRQAPDFMPLLYPEGLLAVNPAAVTIIR